MAILDLYEGFAYNCAQRGGRKTGRFAEELLLDNHKARKIQG